MNCQIKTAMQIMGNGTKGLISCKISIWPRYSPDHKQWYKRGSRKGKFAYARALYATPEIWTRYKERVEADEKSGWLRVVYIIGSENYSGKKPNYASSSLARATISGRAEKKKTLF